MENIPSIILKPTGQKMPTIGLGLWKVPKPTCADTVYTAIKVGYRLFDGAGDYGNEKETGEGIQRAIKDGLVKREDLFITSKLWNTFHKREHVHAVARKQLEFYGIDSFDLFLMHFPISLKYVSPEERYPPEWFVDGNGKVELQNTPIRETWEAMEELVDQGLAKSIGVANFQGSLLLDLTRYARIQPSVLQVEIHPYLTQEPLVQLAKTLGLAVTSYSTFGPSSFIELEMTKGQTVLFEHQTIKTIATKHNKTPAQVILRWALTRGLAIIPKSNNQARLKENLQSSSFDLTQEDVQSINALNAGIRFNDPVDIDPRLAIFA